MQRNETHQFDLERKWNPYSKGYRYLLEFDSKYRRPTGNIFVVYKKLDCYKNKDSEYHRKLYSLFTQHGLSDHDRLAHIVHFFPNGNLEEEILKAYENHGVGTKILNTIEKDAEGFSVNGFFMVTNKNTKDFLVKRGYRVLCTDDSNPKHVECQFVCYKELKVVI
jgi:hypothetical protein